MRYRYAYKDMQQRYAIQICNADMQYRYAIQICNNDMQSCCEGQHAADTQQRYAIQICSTDICNRYAIQICNKEPSMSNQPPLGLSNQTLPPLSCPLSHYRYATKICNTDMQSRYEIMICNTDMQDRFQKVPRGFREDSAKNSQL